MAKEFGIHMQIHNQMLHHLVIIGLVLQTNLILGIQEQKNVVTYSRLDY